MFHRAAHRDGHEELTNDGVDDTYMGLELSNPTYDVGHTDNTSDTHTHE